MSEIEKLQNENKRLSKSLEWVLEMFDKGIIIRNTSKDAEPDYAIRMLDFVTQLKLAKNIVDDAKEVE